MRQKKEANENESIKRLAQKLSCNLVDTVTTSKDYVAMVTAKDTQPISASSYFKLSTCLRYEKYTMSEGNYPQTDFMYVSGKTALKRLLTVLCGLQSEIIGEKEILGQAKDAVEQAFHEGTISDLDYQGLQELFTLASSIRDEFSLTNAENYSTIATDIIMHRISDLDKPTICIVGGGYMASAFFHSLLSHDLNSIGRLIWLNRSTSKIEQRIDAIIHDLPFEVDVIRLGEGSTVLGDADIVFAGVANSPVVFKDTKLKQPSIAIDVSYPAILSPSEGVELINIANTKFAQYCKNEIPSINITKAHSYITSLVKGL